MGLAQEFEKEILVMGVLASDSAIEQQALEAAQSAFGPIDAMTEHEIFTWTDYYNLEMGQPIGRFFLCFQNRVAPDRYRYARGRHRLGRYPAFRGCQHHGAASLFLTGGGR
jgi:hypothetical protein